MNCEQINHDDVMEQYLLGGLDLAARDAFDEHLFECDECFDRLQTVRALRRELVATAAARRAEPVDVSRGWMWTWKWALAPTLAALVVAVIVWPRATPPPTRAPAASTSGPAGVATTSSPGASAAAGEKAVAELGRFQAPIFALASLRGIQDAATARFREAMTHYADRDYRGAVPGLRAALQLDPEATHASFFLGVCYVLTGRLDEGIGALRQTAAAGDSPYLEEAHFYLAKALLQDADPAEARKELERTIRLRGPLETEARRLLADLDRVQAAPH